MVISPFVYAPSIIRVYPCSSVAKKCFASFFNYGNEFHHLNFLAVSFQIRLASSKSARAALAFFSKAALKARHFADACSLFLVIFSRKEFNSVIYFPLILLKNLPVWSPGLQNNPFPVGRVTSRGANSGFFSGIFL
jgi:hypothetical protein